MRVKIVRGEGKTLASGGVGAPGGVQTLVFVVSRAVTLVAEEAVFKAVLIGDMGAFAGFELGEFVRAIRVRA